MRNRLVIAAGVLAAIALAATAAVTARQQSPSSIVGVWRVTEVAFTGPNARKVTNPQPGLRIFTQRYYSRSEVTSDKPRTELPQGQASDKQLADAFGPFTGQAGTYEIRGNEITTRPIAAKNPGVMRAGNFDTAIFVVDGKTLTITTKANAAGPVANPSTWRLTRVE
jgi:hypothetical protein